MSVLSKAKILKRMESGELFVGPLLSAKQMGTNSIDLRLGTVALIVRARGLSHVDPVNYRNPKLSLHQQEKGRRQKLERHEVPFRQQLLLHPGNLTLVPTFEWVSLPSDVMGVVTARSSWAREGLNIATASFINPGYRGIITLELANLGQIPMTLYPGLRIAQIAFHEVGGVAPGDTEQSQFDMSFEPLSGQIGKDDEAFFPPGGTPLVNLALGTGASVKGTP
jgi:dCTP deaminase